MLHQYKYYVSGHHPSSCFYLKTQSYLFLKTQRFEDLILPLSSSKNLLSWAQTIEFSPQVLPEGGDRV
jgi:hypothetical protein